MRAWSLLALPFLAFLVAAGPTDPTTCEQFWPESRYQPSGYDHVVHIRNECTVDASCTVTTNVNPNAMQVEVPASKEVEVVTWMASPVRDFVPRVACTLADDKDGGT